jgi:MYXO-CTERM domain-containing protein
MLHRVTFHTLAASLFVASMLVASSSRAQVTAPYFEDFESEPTCGANCGNACVLATSGWTNDITDNYDWTVDVGGTTSSPTGPSTDHTLGTAAGKYLYTETSSPCFTAPNTSNLISPPLDLTAATAPRASFWYHMFGQSMGNLHVDVSTNGGANWTLDIIPSFTDDVDQWQQTPDILLDAYVGQTILMRLRSEGATNFYGDMAIDDFQLIEASPNDLGVTDVRVDSVCGLSATENLVVDITNYGTSTQSGFNVQVSVNGGAPLVETFSGSIAPSATVTYTFATTSNLSGGGPFTLDAQTALAGDGNPFNDAASSTATNVPFLVGGLPAYDDFEDLTIPQWAGSGGGNEWELGLPSDGIIAGTYSGANSWGTDLNATYANNSEQFLTSGYCLDLSGTTAPGISLAVWWDAQSLSDGAVVQTSTDGSSWTTVGAVGTGVNWYNTPAIAAMPGGSNEGWSGDGINGSNGWVVASHPLTGLAGAPAVLFRVVFASDSATVDEGFAVDRFVVFDDVNGLLAANESPAIPPTMPGATDAWVKTLAIQGTTVGDNIDAITVVQNGSIPDADVAAVKLYLDDGDRTLDPAIDTLVDSQMLTAGQATFNTMGAVTVAAGQVERLHIAVDVAAGATIGDTLQFSIASPGTDIVTTGATPVTALNALDGPTVLVGGALPIPFVDDFSFEPPNRQFFTAPGTWLTATALGVTTTTTTTTLPGSLAVFPAGTGQFTPAPQTGGAHAEMFFPSGTASAAIEYAIDLSAYSVMTDSMTAAFRYGDFGADSNNQDFVFVSPDGGTTWIAVYNLDPTSVTDSMWVDVEVDLSAPIAAAGLDFSADVRLRIQQNDNTATELLAIDEVFVDIGPAMTVERAGAPITEGITDMVGSIAAVPQTLTYTITNSGGFVLNLGPGFFTGNPMNAANLVLTPPANQSLSAGESTTFTVDFEPAFGAFSFDVAFIVQNDPTVSGGSFLFSVEGTGVENAPEIDVQRPAGTSIASGTADPQGLVDAAQTVTLTYTVENLGFLPLEVMGADVTSLGNVTAAVTSMPASTIEAGATSELTVELSPEGEGLFSFDLQITSNDSDEGTYVVTVEGEGEDNSGVGAGGAGGMAGVGGSTGDGGSGEGGSGSGDVDEGGCGCRTAGGHDDGTAGLVALSLLGLAFARRRRKSTSTLRKTRTLPHGANGEDHPR